MIPNKVLQVYDSLMICSHTEVSLPHSRQSLKLSSAAKSAASRQRKSAEQYRLTHSSLNCSVCGVESKEQDSARIPDVEANRTHARNEVVMVALPFSSFQLNPLWLRISVGAIQVEAISSHDVGKNIVSSL